MIFEVVVLPIVCLLLLSFYFGDRTRALIYELPSFRSIPFVTVSKESLSFLVGHTLSVMLQKGRVVLYYTLSPFKTTEIVIGHPTIFKTVFQTDYETFDKATKELEVFSDIAGGLILQSNGQEWKQTRKFFDQFFKPVQMRTYYPMVEKETGTLLDILGKACKDSTSIDIEKLFTDFTFDTICSLVFGKSAGALENSTKLHNTDYGSIYLKAYQYCSSDQMARYIKRLVLPKFLAAPSKEYEKQITLFRSIVTDKIRQWEKTGEFDGTDESMLGTILKDDSNSVPEFMLKDESQLVVQLLSILFAGHDTTANLLTWLVYYLAVRPDIQDQVFEEIKQTAIEDGKIIVERLDTCIILNAVIKETLRLRPSAPALVRVPKKPYKFEFKDESGVDKECTVTPGDIVALNVYSCQQHPTNWPQNPSTWDPKRWLQGDPNGGATSTYAYTPFGWGQRRCLGERFALLEAKYVLASIVSKFQFRIAKGWVVKPMMEMTMKAQHGVGIVLEDR